MKGRSYQAGFFILGAIVFSFQILFFSAAMGAEYPSKPINLIVGAAPGGPLDTHTRILADATAKELGVPIVVVNKAGPGGALAATYVANEKPDGYNFLVTSSSTMTVNFAIYPNLTYKRTDFTPMFMTMIVPTVIAVRADSPFKNLGDLLDAARKSPGKFKSGSFSPTQALVWEGLLKREKADIIHMLYKGSSEVFVALMGGHIDVYCEGLTPIVEHVAAGKIRILAMVASKRNKNYPNIPTVKEAGFSDFSRDFWSGFFGPAGLPKAVMDRLLPVYEKALSDPKVQAQMEGVGVYPSYMGSKDFANFIDNDYKFYAELARQKEK